MTSVLHVISGLGVGGAENMLFQIAGRLRDRGHPQHIVSLTGRGPLADRLTEAGMDVSCVNLKSLTGAPRGVAELIRLVRRVNPDVIQGWMYHGDLMATLLHAFAPGKQCRLAWGVRCSDMDMDRHARVIAIAARLSHRPDVIVANSEAGARTHVARGYRPRRLEIIPNGVDTEGFRRDGAVRAEVRAELGLEPARRLAIHVARVDPMKDHGSFLAALRDLPDVTGVLIGEGTQQLDLPPNALALGRRGDVARLLAAADLIVSSSAFGEGFSNALAEGMSTGLVPVATDVGDARVIVGEAGLVVPPRDAGALRRAIRTLADLDGYTLATRGAAARARIIEQFGLARAIDRFETLYGSLA